jgi:opacity protein-like surface antigen
MQAGASAKAFNFNVGGQYQFSRADSMTPYAGFGLGVLHASSSYSSTFGGTTVSGSSSSSDLYFNVGGGLRYFVNERWGLRPEMMIFAGSNTYVRIGGGIFYHFGR